MSTPRSPLCPRCGAIRGTVRPGAGQRLEGQCPSCGLGYSTTAMVARRISEPPSDVAKAEQRRAQAEVQARKRSAASRCDFAVYGLDGTWAGRRWLGGWGESDGELRSLELAHGDVHDTAAPLVRVHTQVTKRREQGWDLTPEQQQSGDMRHLAQSLAQHLWLDGAEHSQALRSTFTEPDPTARWSPLELTLEGTPTTFLSLTGPVSWIAIRAVIGVLVRNLDVGPVRLAMIEDLEPYLADDGLPR
jgi:hypothetical protein